MWEKTKGSNVFSLPQDIKKNTQNVVTVFLCGKKKKTLYPQNIITGGTEKID